MGYRRSQSKKLKKTKGCKVKNNTQKTELSGIIMDSSVILDNMPCTSGHNFL
jgi:hypothetical protein